MIQNRFSLRHRFASICAVAIACSCLFFIASIARAGEPLATGTFWQIGKTRLQSWSDQQLADEVLRVKEAGMDTILIHYSAVWDTEAQAYRTFVPNTAFPLFDGLKNRDPLAAIFRAAEKQRVKIILGDFLTPTDLRYDDPEKAFAIWLSPEAMDFRRQLIGKFKNSPSFAGYYIANEPSPHRVQDALPQWISGTRNVIRFVKKLKPDLQIIHPIGLYAEWHANSRGELKPSAPSPAYLERFWGPWIEGIPEIDIWMMIDGVGTSLSHLKHTDKAQKWGRSIVHEAGKEFWVDVENAVMNARAYQAFPIDRLTDSLEVAAKHADKIVLFEHLNYMSPNSSKEASRQLYEDYQQYRKTR